MHKPDSFSIVVLAALVCAMTCASFVAAADSPKDPTERRLTLSLDAGQHDRPESPASVLIDAGKANSVYVEYADGSPGRAQLADPGMLNASSRGPGKKELHFMTPKMAKGETATVVVLLSEKPVAGRTYVWTGEPRQSRRVSCMQCHQGTAFPTAAELRHERETLAQTGSPPPLNLSHLLPTAKGRDFRWHEKLQTYESSACWECHGRQMFQYEFGQSLDRDSAAAPDAPHVTDSTQPPPVRSVFHTIFREKDNRTVTHPLPIEDVTSDETARWRIQYGFQQATVGGAACSDILQQHVAILSEEAGKFIGRHNVLIDWTGNTNGKRTVIAREERELMVKNLRGNNRTYAKWFDFVSTLTPVAGDVQFEGVDLLSGFRFVPSLDEDTTPEYRETADWRAITFVSEMTTYTAVCFNHPHNPKPRVETPTGQGSTGPKSSGSGPARAVGYTFSAQLAAPSPLVVHYRLWVQGGRMPTEEIQSMSDDFVDPIQMSAKSID